MSHSHYVPYNSHIFHVRNFCHSWYLCDIRDSNVLHVFFSFDVRRGFWHTCFCVISVLIILTMSGVLSLLVATGGLRTPDIVRMGFDLLKICCPLRLRRLCIFYVVFIRNIYENSTQLCEILLSTTVKPIFLRTNHSWFTDNHSCRAQITNDSRMVCRFLARYICQNFT